MSKAIHHGCGPLMHCWYHGGGEGLPCDKFGRVFTLLRLQQQDEEGSRHHDPCGGYQEFDNKQDDDLRDGSI